MSVRLASALLASSLALVLFPLAPASAQDDPLDGQRVAATRAEPAPLPEPVQPEPIQPEPGQSDASPERMPDAPEPAANPVADTAAPDPASGIEPEAIDEAGDVLDEPSVPYEPPPARRQQVGGDTDGDGIDDAVDLDDDNDGIADADECAAADCTEVDTDGDGRTDITDLDSDNDGISDHLESGQFSDADNDGKVDGFIDLNNDGLADGIQAVSPSDTDGDGIPNFLDLDSDNDGIPDFVEARPSSGYEQALGTEAGVADPIICAPGFIQVINDTPYGKGQLFISDPITGANYPVGESSGYKINAISYDPQTQLIYGVAREAGVDSIGTPVPKTALVSIDLDGETFLVHDKSPIGVSGAMIGRHLIGVNSTNRIVGINVDTGEQSSFTFSPKLSRSLKDIILVGNQIFAMDADGFFRITDPLGTPVIEEFKSGVVSTSAFGSAFSATDAETGEISMYFFENATGTIYTVADPTGPDPTISVWGQAGKSGSNDGTSCEGAAAPSEDTDTDGDGVPNWWDEDIDGDGVSNSGLVVPVNTDLNDDGADYIDTNSDEDSYNDIDESGLELSGIDANGDGIDDSIGASYLHPAGNITDPPNDLDSDKGDPDVSYRDFDLPPEEFDPGIVPITREVVFIVDGSMSIDTTDWGIQLGGIAAALQDPTAFPTDGSVAVGLVQWSDTAEEEVAYTLLDSPAALQSVIEQIKSIEQNLGYTMPELGVDIGNKMLAQNGNRDAEQVLCMSTDGRPIDRAKVIASGAAAAAAGVDSMALLAIDDPSRNFDSIAAQYQYGDAVFGNGSVIQARSSIEFAGLIVSGCLSGALSLVGLEINQSVQDWTGSVPLVAGKSTVVRAFVQSLDSEPDRIVARLHAERDGVALPQSPLNPINTGGSALAYQDARTRRADLDASLNFELPKSWTKGDVTLTVELLGGKPLCREAIAPANTCSANVSFGEVTRPQVKVLRVQYEDSGKSVTPTGADVVEQVRRLESTLPVSGIDYKQKVLFTGSDGAPPIDAINESLLSARKIDGSGSIYLGVLSGDPINEAATKTSIGAASWFIDGSEASDATGYARNQGTKEFARAMGEALASNSSGVAYCSTLADKVEGAPAYPYVGQVDGSEVALLGPAGNSDTEIWGIDARSLELGETLAVIDPSKVYSALSFCESEGFGDQGQWIDQFHYERLLTDLNAVDWSVGPESSNAQYSFFRGSIDMSGQVATAALGETLVVEPGVVPEAQPSGEFALDLLDASGAVVRSVPFDPTPVNADTSGELGVFTIAIEGNPEFESVVVSQADVELARRQASANTPTVEITAPAAGDSFANEDLEITWLGDDADGDALTYLVQYSTNAGATYETIAIDYPGDSMVIPADALTGSDQVRVRVTVSDGVLSASAESANFTVANLAPTVSITSPQADQRFDGVQSLLLTAEGFDSEDGALDPGTINWTSDIHGQLGAGGQIVLNAADLDEGFHRFTAMTSDSAGNTAIDHVDVEIRRIAAPPEAAALCQGLQITVDIGEGELPTDGDDVILGTPGHDVILGGAGNDVICGLTGDDVIYGQAGDDVIYGDAGADKLRGGPGNDRIYAGDGVDDAAGGTGDDHVFGEGGSDAAVRGGTGNDIVDGGAGNDLLVAGNGGDDIVTGGSGDDKVTGGPRPDTVSGGSGNDLVKGNKGADILDGGEGDDHVLGGPQRDTIVGGAGDDVCNGGITGMDSNGNLAIEDDASSECEEAINMP